MPWKTSSGSGAAGRLARAGTAGARARQRRAPPVLVLTRYENDAAVAFDEYADERRAESVVLVQKLVPRPAGERPRA